MRVHAQIQEVPCQPSLMSFAVCDEDMYSRGRRPALTPSGGGAGKCFATAEFLPSTTGIVEAAHVPEARFGAAEAGMPGSIGKLVPAFHFMVAQAL